MGRLWQYLVGVIGILAALLWGSRQQRQRERAESERDRAEREADSMGRKAKLAREIEQARSDERQEASDNAARKEAERRSGDRPSGNVGDRLRNDD